LTGYGAICVKVSVTDPEAIISPDARPAVPTREQAVIAALRTQIAVLTAQNTALLARLAELERRFGLNSSNSGKPPSSDGLKKPLRTLSLRDRSKKTSGGQTGHPGKTLCQVANPDKIVEHVPTLCAGCGEASARRRPVTSFARSLICPRPSPWW
jgi:transposase